ncbi:MAG: energy transducer TonB, partial [Gemmatimonadota bacterium]
MKESDRRAIESAARGLRFLPLEGRGSGWVRLAIPLAGWESARDGSWAPGADTGFTPFEERPELKNPAAAKRAVANAYPESLRRAGYGGSVTLWAFVDTAGTVTNVRVASSSGHPLLDEAAERVLWELDFHPATNKGWKVPVWIQQQITFTTRPGRRDFPKDWRRPERFALGSVAHPVVEATTTSPYFYSELASRDRPDPPELIRPDSVEAALSRLFLEAGARADLGVDVELTVDVEGLVRDARLAAILPEGTSDSALAYRVVDAVRDFRLRPALVEGNRKPLPLTARFIFVPELGLAPSAGGGCDADSALRAQPQLNLVEPAAEMTTPVWERARVIAETWPVSLQRRGRRYEYRFWVLVDAHGRVCEVEPISGAWIAAGNGRRHGRSCTECATARRAATAKRCRRGGSTPSRFRSDRRGAY